MASSASTISFSEGPLFRQLLSFALPLMAVNILQYVYQAVDMAVVGQVVGDVGLVSMSNAVNAVFLVNAFVIGLSAGGGVVVARAVGAGDVGAQRRAYAATLLVALLASAGIAAAGTLLARPAFTANAVPAAALDGAVAYTTVLCCGAVGPFLMNAAAAFLKAQGDAWTPLLLVGAATFVNVALDLVLVGPAGLGVPGAAVATVAAQGLSTLLALALVRRRFAAGRVLGSNVLAGGFAADVRAVLSVGVPSAVQMAVVNLSYALVTGMLNRYGVDVAAAAGVGLQISTIAGLPCWAIGQAITHGGRAVRRCRRARARPRRRAAGSALQYRRHAGHPGAHPAARAGHRGALRPHAGRAIRHRRALPAHHVRCERPVLRGHVQLRLVRSRGRLAATRAGELAHRRVRRAFRPGVFALGRARLRLRGHFNTRSSVPVIPAIIGGVYLRRWSRSRGVLRER